jgi:hypothetical protein
LMNPTSDSCQIEQEKKLGHTHDGKETATPGPVKMTFNKRAPSVYIDAQISSSLKFQESHATSAWLVCTEN